MGDINDLGQKIKGKYQKAKGGIEQNSGSTLKGTFDKVKGNINEGLADSKLKERNSKADRF